MIAFIVCWTFYGEIDKIIEGIQENQEKIESFCAMNRKTTKITYSKIHV